MANKYRGEIAFPLDGKETFIRFELSDLAELEAVFGEEFFSAIEAACARASVQDIPKILAIGLKVREGAEDHRAWASINQRAILEAGFRVGEAAKPIMDAVCWSWLQKSYDDVVAEAIEAAKKADAEKLKRAKEAADEAGIPFNEALSDGLLKLLTDMASAR